LFKPNEHVLVGGCVESQRQKVGNQLSLSRNKLVAVNHMLLRAFDRTGHSLSVHSATHSTGPAILRRIDHNPTACRDELRQFNELYRDPRGR
jgi:hypothetical protein